MNIYIILNRNIVLYDHYMYMYIYIYIFEYYA